jgi:hypothetical protein
MVLMAITGNLGAGKTLCLTYLAYRNLMKGLKIYSNYHLEFPFEFVSSVKTLDKMTNGFFAGDELWSWLDARVSSSKRNRAVNKILLSSRKRGIHFAYTTQSFRQTDVRIRKITDFIAVPNLSPNNDWCRLVIYNNPTLDVLRAFKFRTDKYFRLYDTREEVSALDI